MRKVSYEIGLPIGSRAKLGLIVLQADETIEYEFWQLISKLDLALHVSRIPSNSKVSKDGLMAMKKELTEAASLFPEKIRFNGCRLRLYQCLEYNRFYSCFRYD